LFGFGREVNSLDVGAGEGVGRSCSCFSIHKGKKF
jgi:hypothetical protein